MQIQFKLQNGLGTFTSETISVTKEQYDKIVELSKTFYNNGYEMSLPNGFLVASPEIVKQSILIIEVIN